MKFPTLYKLNNTGSIQFWDIETAIQIGQMNDKEYAPEWGLITTSYGQVNTDSPQLTFDTITEGKNIGKANETTAFEQACAEAKSKWERQKKKGYVESVAAAKAGELDDLIEGGIVPMLAHTFEKQGHKIKYPAMVQRKYDGIRLIAMVKNGKVSLWSRTRKQVNSLPHIIKEIESLKLPNSTILDGEAYNHSFKSNFEHIVHLVRQEEPDSECTDVQYHIYDLVTKDPFKDRIAKLGKILKDTEYLVQAPTFIAESESDVIDYYNSFKAEGMEGAMIRNMDGLYVNKRSSDLIKVKEMQDDEFEIIGIEEGRGKLAGHVGAFVCRTRDGQEFKAKPSGATERLREYFCNHGLWEGRQLVVQFQDLTSYGIPRFPVGLRLKEQI